MANLITLTGRLVADPELRFTKAGKPVCTFTLADDYGHRDRNTNEWVKDGSTFLRVEVWGHHAEQCTEHLRKGQRTIVVGEIRQRDWQTDAGEKRQAFEVKNVSEVGPALDKWAPRGQQSGGHGQQQAQRQPQDDPWGSAPVDETAPF